MLSVHQVFIWCGFKLGSEVHTQGLVTTSLYELSNLLHLVAPFVLNAKGHKRSNYFLFPYIHMGFAIILYIFYNKYAWIKCSLKVIKSNREMQILHLYFSFETRYDSELTSLTYMHFTLSFKLHIWSLVES